MPFKARGWLLDFSPPYLQKSNRDEAYHVVLFLLVQKWMCKQPLQVTEVGAFLSWKHHGYVIVSGG